MLNEKSYKMFNQIKFEMLGRDYQELFNTLGTFNPEQLHFKPGAGKWSLLQIIEHLVLAEISVLNCRPDLQRPIAAPKRLFNAFNYLLVVGVLKLGIPVPVVSSDMEPQGDLSLSSLYRQWDTNRQKLKRHMQAPPSDLKNRLLFCHPVAGPLTLKKTLHVGRLHFHSHRSQIDRNIKILSRSN
jgi:hypothetical protein